jgi:hypothetical protein
MVNITRSATIIAFRAPREYPTAMEWVKNRVTTFKGTVIGTTGDGYDIAAAFNSEDAARRFLVRYFDGDVDPIGTYIITEAYVIAEAEATV